MAGVAEDGRDREALDSVREILGTEHGIRLVWEPFHDYDPKIGSISIVLPGTKENGSVFTHPNPWVMCAETVIGRGGNAVDYFHRINPAAKNDRLDVYKVEPYVFTQWTGLPPFKHVGRGANPWLTGSAAWMMLASSQYIMGLKPEYDGLRIDPCVPAGWTAFEMTRVFRGATFNIHVSNPDGVEKGVASVTLDGKAVHGNLIPVQPAGTEHDVEVVMG